MIYENVPPMSHPCPTHVPPMSHMEHPVFGHFCKYLKINRNYPKFSHEKLTTPSPHSFESVVSFSTQLLGNFCLFFYIFLFFFKYEFLLMKVLKGGREFGYSAIFLWPLLFFVSKRTGVAPLKFIFGPCRLLFFRLYVLFRLSNSSFKTRRQTELITFQIPISWHLTSEKLLYSTTKSPQI